MNSVADDLKRFVLALAFFAFAVAAASGFWLGRATSVEQRAAIDTMRVITVQRETVTVTIKVREKARTHWDTVVRNVSDTQVVVQRDTLPPDTVTVPVEVIRRDQAKDSLLASLYVDRRLDSLWHIQDATLPHKPPPRWALSVGPGYVCRENGCGLGVALTFSYRIR